MSLVYDGNIIATKSPQVTISREAYNALSKEVRENPEINYFVYDDANTDYERYMKLSTLLGSEEELKKFPTGTVLGAIKDLYDRLGGLSFKIDPAYNHVEATYSDEIPNNNIQELNPDATLTDKIAHMEGLFGSVDNFAGTGYDTVVTALRDLYDRLNDLSFKFDDANGTVEVSDIKE